MKHDIIIITLNINLSKFQLNIETWLNYNISGSKSFKGLKFKNSEYFLANK